MAATKPKLPPLNVRRDTLDFRDKMYMPTLYEVPAYLELDEYKSWKVPVLNQGTEGACTGFGLATVANYLLRRRKVVPDTTSVSPRMMYEMARRYDEWPGEKYSGSSARGAMKGWHKHGVCGLDCWPYKKRQRSEGLNDMRTADALKRPLGAYYRVNHQDLVAMHSAMAEVGVLFATAVVHEGWENTDDEGVIPFENKVLGGHAFAIVAYNERGFWIQNSWGDQWGNDGFALITYDDWLANGTDCWVARLGAPVMLYKTESTAITHSAAAAKSRAYAYSDLRPHIISIGNNGQLKPGGNFGTTENEMKTIFQQDFTRVTANWKKKRLLLYAHGGLVSEAAAVQRLADYRAALLEAEVYPISFIWRSDGWTTITNILQDAFRRRKPEGFLDSAKDFMLNRLDDALEPVARTLTGKLQWDEMKQNALAATTSSSGGARLALKEVVKLANTYGNNFELHIAGHSAGSIFHAPLIQLLTSAGKITSGSLKGQTGLGQKVKTCTLWAPACTISLFKATYLPAIKNKSIQRFAVFNLTDQVEQDDHCGHIYNKSLLYLVSNAFEDKYRIPIFKTDDGEPILGLYKFIQKDPELMALFDKAKADLVLSPNTEKEGTDRCSTARAHGDFDDDKATVNATLARILNVDEMETAITFERSASSLQARRNGLENV